MQLTDEQEKSIAAEKERARGCTCDPQLTVRRNVGVFSVATEIRHASPCPLAWRTAAPNELRR